MRHLGAGPESIIPAGAMDSGLVLRTPRNDVEQKFFFGFKLMLPVQSPLAKIFRFTSEPNHFYIARIPAQHRGAFRDRHERRAGDAMDAGCASDESVSCGRRSRVVLTPRRRRQVGERSFTGDGDKKARSPGRVRRKPLKPLRAGMPGDFRCDRCEYSCACYTTTSHTRLRVHWAPGIPHALFWGGSFINISGTIRAAGIVGVC